MTTVTTVTMADRQPRRPRWATRSRGTLALYRFAVALLGGLVLAVGVVLIPYPGPGWLVVFAGLAILASEYRWARRLLSFLRARYAAWLRWVRRRNLAVRLALYTFTVALVLATLWVLGVFALVGGWFGVHQAWMASPFFG